ncbi:hypothetical protein ACHAPT_012183 [Fusarium lateritium]
MAQYEEIRDIEFPLEPLTPKSTLSYSEAALDNLDQYDAICKPVTNESRTSLVLPEPGPEHPRRRYSWKQSIGILGVLTLVVGTLIILASCAILIFLWRGAETAADREETLLWKTIVFHGWAPGTVTICSAAMRTLITLQLGLLVAALSATMLETSGVCFVDIPVVSAERALLSSPVNILFAVIRRARRDFLGLAHSFIIIMAVIVMLLSTFISTVLLSDFRTNQIAAPATMENLSLTFEENDKFYDDNGVSYWKSKPTAWRFAETQVGEPGSPSDTGDTYRAILPFSNETSRASLELYSGPAIVINTRTICSPLPLDEFIITTTSPGQPQNEKRKDDDSAPPKTLSDPKSGRPYFFWQVIVLNTTGYMSEFPNETYPYDSDSWNLTSKSKGLWTTAYSNGESMVTASICYFNVYRPQRYKVNMSGRAIPFGPADTDSKHLQLNSSAPPRSGRGILDLEIDSRMKDDCESPVDPTFNNTLGERPGESESAWNMMYDGDSDFRWRAHQEHSSVFQSIIQNTSNPTMAIQALGTRIHQMIYYDWFQDYDLQYEVETIHSTERLIPGRWIGLTLVLVLIGVHLTLVFTTVVLFMLKTKASALGNAWQAVAQIARAANLLESPDRMLDKEVGEKAKTTGLDKDVYTVSESAEGDGVEIQLRNRKGS